MSPEELLSKIEELEREKNATLRALIDDPSVDFNADEISGQIEQIHLKTIRLGMVLIEHKQQGLGKLMGQLLPEGSA